MSKGGRVHHRELVALIAAIAVVTLTPVPVAGQEARTWTPPRTADGQPDLQNVWLSNGATPLERPAALADRATLTDEEVATLQARADRIFKDGRSAFAVPATTFRAAFENVDKYLGESTSSSIGMVDMKFSRRTSLVVGPPDGRIPTLTPEAQRTSRRGRRRVAIQDRTGRPQQHSSMYHDRRASARWKFWRRTVQLLPDCADTRICGAHHGGLP